MRHDKHIELIVQNNPPTAKTVPTLPEKSEQSKEDRSDSDKRRRLLNYEVGSRLGKGSYAVVHLAVDVDSSKKYALKSYEKEKMNSNTRKAIIENEIKVLNTVNHPKVVKLHKVIQTKNHVDFFHSDSHSNGPRRGHYSESILQVS